MIDLLKGFSFIDYCNDNARVGNLATIYFSTWPWNPASEIVSDGLVRRSVGYELPAARPNVLYIVPLHVFMDLETVPGRTDYITPIQEMRGNGVEYLAFRVSAKQQDIVILSTSSVGQHVMLDGGFYWTDYEGGGMHPCATMSEQLKDTVNFYSIFLNKAQ